MPWSVTFYQNKHNTFILSDTLALSSSTRKKKEDLSEVMKSGQRWCTYKDNIDMYKFAFLQRAAHFMTTISHVSVTKSYLERATPNMIETCQIYL